jgi:hypothetical protein
MMNPAYTRFPVAKPALSPDDSAAMRRWIFSVALLGLSVPASAQLQSLGVFQLWGAFRQPGRCYAIAEPFRSPRPEAWRPFASVGYWPGRGVRSQLHIRLSREKRAGSAVLLRIDDQTFQLVGGGNNAWAPDRNADADIVAAMRTGLEMNVETRSTGGGLVRDSYKLRGAATAIDAAAIACAK